MFTEFLDVFAVLVYHEVNALFPVLKQKLKAIKFCEEQYNMSLTDKDPMKERKLSSMY
jgi:hypothetical protein